MTHRHTGHGPDRKSDCPGCEDEYYAGVAEQWSELQHRTPYDRDILERTIVYHWPTQTAGCLCGWGELGMSFPGHVADMYEANVRVGHVCDPRRCCAACDRHVTPHRGCILR